MELLKLLTTSEIVAQTISFLILFFILRAFAWKRILKLLDTRKERIASEFKRIEEDQKAVDKARAEYEEKLKTIEITARAKLAQAVIDAEKIKQELKEDARQEARKIIEHAQGDIHLEIIKAKEVLKDEITDLVLDATEHLLEEKMTEKEDRRVIKDFLEGIDKLK